VSPLAWVDRKGAEKKSTKRTQRMEDLKRNISRDQSALSKRVRFWPEAISKATRLTRPVRPLAKAPHLLPIFRFGPNLPLVHGLLMDSGLMVVAHALERGSMEAVVQLPIGFTRGTLHG
jgi:hypothetical protein